MNKYRVTIETLDEDGNVIQSTMRTEEADNDAMPWWVVLGNAVGSALEDSIPRGMWDAVVASLCVAHTTAEEPSVFCALASAWSDTRDEWKFREVREVASNIRIVLTPPFNDLTDFSSLLAAPAARFVTVADTLPMCEADRAAAMGADAYQAWMESLPRTKQPET